MVNINESEQKVPFYCAVTNTFGMYWGKVRVEGDKPNQKAWRIAYIPLKHAKKALVKGTVSNMKPKRYVELTKVKYPDSGVMWPFSPKAEPVWEDQAGRFSQLCLAYESTSEYDSVLDKVEEFSAQKNAELERENRKLKQQLSHNELENLENEHKESETSDNTNNNHGMGVPIAEDDEGWDNV